MSLSKFLILNLLALSLFSCGNKDNSQTQKAQVHEELDQGIKLSANSVQLSEKAQENLRQWSDFMSVKAEVSQLKRMNLRDVVNNSNTLQKSVKRMADSIPKKFRTNAVLGRVKVLWMEVSMLDQHVQNRNYTKESLRSSARGIYKAFNNLKIQLNEVFLQPLEDIEAEMDQAIRDSISEEKSGSGPD